MVRWYEWLAFIVAAAALIAAGMLQTKAGIVVNWF